jgi:hypothetical protein
VEVRVLRATHPHFPFTIWGRKVREGGHALPPEFAIEMRNVLEPLLTGKRGLIRR